MPVIANSSNNNEGEVETKPDIKTLAAGNQKKKKETKKTLKSKAAKKKRTKAKVCNIKDEIWRGFSVHCFLESSRKANESSAIFRFMFVFFLQWLQLQRLLYVFNRC